jgi:hypothetical protein
LPAVQQLLISFYHNISSDDDLELPSPKDLLF